MTQLTREYFIEHGYEFKPFKLEGVECWGVELHKRYENGDHVYADVEISNLMYTERFAFSGHIGNQCYFQTVMLYSVEDLENLYKLSHVRYDEKTKDFYCVNDYECNKDIKV
jgi:hypothetical protein